MGKADLHIHSTASDGNSSPSEIVALALKQNLELIALTDHDTIAGVREAHEAARGKDITVITGAEITAGFEGREAHMLAYCFDPDHPELEKMLKSHKKARLNRGAWIIHQLAKQGLDLNMQEVKAEARGNSIGRPHIASVLVDKGYVASAKEAFIRYLSDQRLGAIPSEYFPHHEVIHIVKQAGGAVVVAHPGQMYTKEELAQLVAAGIDGLEVIHPSHNYELQKKMEEFATNYQLLITGGSDFHGGKRDYQRYFGLATINSEQVYAMIRMTRQRKELSVS